MKKTATLVGLLLFSAAIQASSFDNLSSSLVSTMKNYPNEHPKSPFAIVYGGKDFSLPQIAIADESKWTGHSSFIG